MLAHWIGAVRAALERHLPGRRMAEAGAASQRGVWCVVANAPASRPYGPGGAETRDGLKHFPPGAKLYCFPPLWGDGYEQIQVVGCHRGSHRYATMVVSSRWLTNWRVQVVYSPHVIAALGHRWDETARSKALADNLVRAMRSRAAADTPPGS